MVRFPTQLREIAGHLVTELAREFSTPVFVYDAATIVQRLDDLSAFDTVRFAQKACSNIAGLGYCAVPSIRGACRV